MSQSKGIDDQIQARIAQLKKEISWQIESIKKVDSILINS
jgi:hypothetical protein